MSSIEKTYPHKDIDKNYFSKYFVIEYNKLVNSNEVPIYKLFNLFILKDSNIDKLILNITNLILSKCSLDNLKYMV
jgi:hypothetical protein